MYKQMRLLCVLSGILSVCCLSKAQQMKMIEIRADKFPVNWDFHTETLVYDQLKKNPIKADCTYVALPFTWTYHHNELNSLAKKHHVNGGFSVCQIDLYEVVLPAAKQLGIDVFFVASCAGETYEGIKLLPFPQHPIHAVGPAKKKDIYYSFIGFNTHPIRTKLFAAVKSKRNVIMKQRAHWHFWVPNEKIRDSQKKEYQDVLARSRFSLCPRGNGRGTIRFWESLCAGAIPVVIPAEDLWLPGCFDWNSCVISLQEKDIGHIEQILAKITPEQEAYMREQCYKAYEQFCGENYTSCIRKYYEEGPWEPWNPLVSQ
jgi:hypothetical protein